MHVLNCHLVTHTIVPPGLEWMQIYSMRIIWRERIDQFDSPGKWLKKGGWRLQLFKCRGNDSGCLPDVLAHLLSHSKEEECVSPKIHQCTYNLPRAVYPLTPSQCFLIYFSSVTTFMSSTFASLFCVHRFLPNQHMLVISMSQWAYVHCATPSDRLATMRLFKPLEICRISIKIITFL